MDTAPLAATIARIPEPGADAPRPLWWSSLLTSAAAAPAPRGGAEPPPEAEPEIDIEIGSEIEPEIGSEPGPEPDQGLVDVDASAEEQQTDAEVATD